MIIQARKINMHYKLLCPHKCSIYNFPVVNNLSVRFLHLYIHCNKSLDIAFFLIILHFTNPLIRRIRKPGPRNLNGPICIVELNACDWQAKSCYNYTVLAKRNYKIKIDICFLIRISTGFQILSNSTTSCNSYTDLIWSDIPFSLRLDRICIVLPKHEIGKRTISIFGIWIAETMIICQQSANVLCYNHCN